MSEGLFLRADLSVAVTHGPSGRDIARATVPAAITRAGLAAVLRRGLCVTDDALRTASHVVGNGLRPASLYDTGLQYELLSGETGVADSDVTTDHDSVTLRVTLPPAFTSVSGELSEAGVRLADGQLFMRGTHKPIHAGAGIVVTYSWTLRGTVAS